jgi:hypothetical protein
MAYYLFVMIAPLNLKRRAAMRYGRCAASATLSAG